MHLRADADMPDPLWRWQLAERFGWTLGTVDSLTLADLHQFMQIEDGRIKAGK